MKVAVLCVCVCDGGASCRMAALAVSRGIEVAASTSRRLQPPGGLVFKLLCRACSGAIYALPCCCPRADGRGFESKRRLLLSPLYHQEGCWLFELWDVGGF